MSAADIKVNQVLRVTLEGVQYRGMVVNASDDAVLIATTAQEAPTAVNGTTVQGELHKADGLSHFTTRLLGYQMAPVLVLILDRPKAIRRIQRRREPRHPVDLTARLVYISAEKSINTEVAITNVSFGGLEAISPLAPPQGFHCVVLLRYSSTELATICQVMHVDPIESGARVGLSFVEMSRRDLETLHYIISKFDHSDA